MLSNVRPAHGIAVGVIFVCALGLVARYINAPLPRTLPAASIPAHASARPIESEAPLSAEPPFLTGSTLPNDPSLSSADESTDHGILACAPVPRFAKDVEDRFTAVCRQTGLSLAGRSGVSPDISHLRREAHLWFCSRSWPRHNHLRV